MVKHLGLKAYGKINLGLDVLRKREDGYHEVRMIMQTVGLYDRLDLICRSEPGIRVETNLYYLPNNENNLVYQAADLLMKEFGVSQGLHIRLRKFIPVAAGMAGGSSDAAAVLFGVNKMFGLGLSQQQLMVRGVKIGADVPYCILRGTALSEGIGEKLTPLPPMPQCRVLIARPGISVSTRSVYENLRADRLRQEQHPDIDAMNAAIGEGDIHRDAGLLGNVLETVTNPYLGADTTLSCSPDTAAKIDEEVNEMIRSAHEKAIGILKENTDKLHELARYLIEKETITGEEFMEILNG